MTDLNRPNSGNLDAIRTSDGVVISANKLGLPATWGCTLVAGTTYVFPFGAQHAPVPAEASFGHFHLRWDAAVIVTFTIETSSWPQTVQPLDQRGPIDVSDFDTTAGNWMLQNPTSGVYISGSGSGGLTVTNATMVVAGGTAGGTDCHIGNLASRRIRIKAVVGGTGGLVRCAVWGKGI